MFSFQTIAILALLSGFASASPIAKRDILPSACLNGCGSASNAFSICLSALPPGFNATTDLIADVTYLTCSCTDAIALYTATCTSCLSTLGVSTPTNDTIGLIDGSSLFTYNKGCTTYANGIDKTWTNATYTQSGGLHGAGAVIPSFAVVAPKASTAGERLKAGGLAGLALVGALALVL